MLLRSIPGIAVVAAGVAFGATNAFATNGYFTHAHSIKDKGLAGAGIALSQDALAAASNPAGMVRVGDRIDAGAALFSPHRSYTVTGAPSGPPAFGLQPETIDSDSEYFLIPHFGWNRMLGADRAVGISVYANGGMNTDYPGSAAGGAGTFFGEAFGGKANTGVDLSQLFIGVTYAQQATPAIAWGISPILAYQRFEATGLAAFGDFSSDPANLTDNGHDSSFGYGARLGVTADVRPGLTLAAAYQTEMKMDEFDKYRGLFAEQGGFDIPAAATLGLAWLRARSRRCSSTCSGSGTARSPRWAGRCCRPCSPRSSATPAAPASAGAT
jgi:long-chain fatty acid transport protein